MCYRSPRPPSLADEMAAVRGLRVLVKSAAAGVVNEPEPMEVEEGEVEAVPDAVQEAVQDVAQDVQEGSSPREVVSVCEVRGGMGYVACLWSPSAQAIHCSVSHMTGHRQSCAWPKGGISPQ